MHHMDCTLQHIRCPPERVRPTTSGRKVKKPPGRSFFVLVSVEAFFHNDLQGAKAVAKRKETSGHPENGLMVELHKHIPKHFWFQNAIQMTWATVRIS